MHRICGSLARNGYKVTLVGRKLPGSLPLRQAPYRQVRLKCFFKKGKWFYAEYNVRLLCFLLFRRMDAICAIDLDTILPCFRVSRWKNIPRVYDAHELFTELKEVISRPRIHRIWSFIEARMVPKFKYGYTVSEGIARIFEQRYGVHYSSIRNVPPLQEQLPEPLPEKFILYQGAVNEARAFEYLVPAMLHVDCRLVICGDGNFMGQLKELIRAAGMEDRIELKGMLPPDKLRALASRAYMGIALAEKDGLNQWLALPNKFFDYMHAALPQVTMNFPEYRRINEQYEVAVLIDSLEPERIAGAVNNLLENDVLHRRLQQNCLKARLEFNWQKEEEKLLAFYQSIFNQ